MSRSVFAETLGNTLTVALGPHQHLVTGDDDGKILLWNTEEGQKLRIFQGKIRGVKSIAFSPDGDLIASGSDDQTVRIWKVSTGECLDRWSGHQDTIQCVNFSPDGQMLATGSDDQSIRVWDVRSGQCLHILNGHQDGIRTVIFSRDSTILASSSEDQTVRLWSMSAGESLRTFTGNSTCNWTVTLVESVVKESSSKNGYFKPENSINLQSKTPENRWIASSCDEEYYPVVGY